MLIQYGSRTGQVWVTCVPGSNSPPLTRPCAPIVVGCSMTFSCTPKDVKVHADNNRALVLLTNPTSFIGIIKHLNDTRSAYNSISVLA